MTKRSFLDVGLLGRIQVACADKRLYDNLTRQTEIQINLIEGEAIVAHPLS